MVEDQLDEPFVFAPFHEAWTEENNSPHDHLAMDTAFMEPMYSYSVLLRRVDGVSDFRAVSRRLDPNDSVLLGSERVKDIEALLAKGDNVVLLSNHQTEADPSCWSFALHENHERLERDMIMVAGDRVTTDVVAVPFSKARNLLCIYSKRHIDNPPEEKSKKMRHNAKTMTVCLRRLSVLSRRRRDSSPSSDEVGGFLVDVGAVRTWSRRRRRGDATPRAGHAPALQGRRQVHLGRSLWRERPTGR